MKHLERKHLSKYSEEELQKMNDVELVQVAREQLVTRDYVGSEAKTLVLEEIVKRWHDSVELAKMREYNVYSGDECGALRPLSE